MESAVKCSNEIPLLAVFCDKNTGLIYVSYVSHKTEIQYHNSSLVKSKTARKGKYKRLKKTIDIEINT